MANLNFHPRSHGQRALGDLQPGWFDLPQDAESMVTDGIKYTPRIGELLQGTARFVVPQNPVRDYASGQVKMLGTSGGGCDSGLGCACEGSINGMSLGDISSDWATLSGSLANGDWSAALSDTIMGIPVWIAVMAGLAFATISGSGKRRR